MRPSLWIDGEPGVPVVGFDNLKLPVELFVERFFEHSISLIGEDRLHSPQARSYWREQLQGPLRYVISSRMYDQALKQYLRTGSNVSFPATGLP